MSAYRRFGGRPMIRISLPYIYNLAGSLNPLANVAALDRNNALYAFIQADANLKALLNESVFTSTLRMCVETGQSLSTKLSELVEKGFKGEEQYTVWELQAVAMQFQQFKTELLAELGVLPSYFVTQKAGFDTETLLATGHRLFSSELPAKAPEAIFDTREAAKALAYELPTSAGFHVFRALESVLRRYYTEVTGGQPQPRARNIAVYIKKMHQLDCGDPLILSALEQISALHRNPLIHPEVVLTMDEGISVVGIANSVMTSMLKQLPPVPQTTTTALGTA